VLLNYNRGYRRRIRSLELSAVTHYQSVRKPR